MLIRFSVDKLFSFIQDTSSRYPWLPVKETNTKNICRNR